ncbi:uncharacterized protein LAESUDRAFT_352306 [Laetiporus sulphureus 93-53]|uniref:Uncharacterized protein n=1 Tax=Laetiporus sulphureus 93-53 TaxID=1314785 RepID=A0A165GUS0_9APHY|nr:uncharacterized protein LAESUDRAFT_352306 [Laetiporus sulphureus 93-53]KZT10839.1 hypothetical protein LAESUDRAFT_352306 [Laetiporus sulphureus 93-53]
MPLLRMPHFERKPEERQRMIDHPHPVHRKKIFNRQTSELTDMLRNGRILVDEFLSRRAHQAEPRSQPGRLDRKRRLIDTGQLERVRGPLCSPDLLEP